jgi:hypothetical protein
MLTNLKTKSLRQQRLGLLLLSFCFGKQSFCFRSLLSRR